MVRVIEGVVKYTTNKQPNKNNIIQNNFTLAEASS
jgi:hypothetical protein